MLRRKSHNRQNHCLQIAIMKLALISLYRIIRWICM